MRIKEAFKRKRVLLATLIIVCVAAIPLILTSINLGSKGFEERDGAGTGATKTEAAGSAEIDSVVPESTEIGKDVADPDFNEGAIGSTSIAKWKGNKDAAFTLGFDDSMVSHADIALPALLERGLVATWYINPGKEHYQRRQEVWEQTIPATDHELANHTMHHDGARNFEEAEYEIGETARLIWSLRSPEASKFLSFERGGATSWRISEEEWQILNEKYHLVERGDSRSMTDASAEDMIAQANIALDHGIWIPVHFHGIGGEWLWVETQDFLEFLDYLVSTEGNLWIGTYGSVYKYIQERDTAELVLIEVSDDIIRLSLTSAMPPDLYDEPLTLLTQVPPHWTSCEVTQAGKTRSYQVLEGFVQYEVVPGLGEIKLVPIS